MSIGPSGFCGHVPVRGGGFPEDSMRIVLPIGRAVFTSIATLALNSALQAHEDSESGGLLHDEYSLGTTFSAPGVPGKWGPAVLGNGATVTWSIIDGGVSLNGASYNGGSTYNGNSVGLGSLMTTFDYLGQIQAASMHGRRWPTSPSSMCRTADRRSMFSIRPRNRSPISELAHFRWAMIAALWRWVTILPTTPHRRGS